MTILSNEDAKEIKKLLEEMFNNFNSSKFMRHDKVLRAIAILERDAQGCDGCIYLHDELEICWQCSIRYKNKFTPKEG